MEMCLKACFSTAGIDSWQQLHNLVYRHCLYSCKVVTYPRSNEKRSDFIQQTPLVGGTRIVTRKGRSNGYSFTAQAAPHEEAKTHNQEQSTIHKNHEQLAILLLLLPRDTYPVTASQNYGTKVKSNVFLWFVTSSVYSKLFVVHPFPITHVCIHHNAFILFIKR